MLGKVFKAYDVRGAYPDPLNERMAWQIGYGASSFLLTKAAAAGDTTPMMKHIVVGRDMRKSSPSLVKQLIKGVTDHGGNVIDVGLVDTPFIYFAINHLDCAGGIQTTASHNPPQYNGFKVSARRGAPVGEATGLADIRRLAAMADEASRTEPEHKGRVEQRDLWEPYIAHVRSFLDLNGRTLKVVVDASNGMAGTMVPRIFGHNGANVQGLEILEINFENSRGEFVHEANPLLPSALTQTREAVVKERADLGICFDGDADRIVVVDEKGKPVGCDHLTAWLAKWFLKDNPGQAVVYDLRSSKALEEDVLKAGGKPVRSRVGHVFIKSLLKEHTGVFGGELSGHFYFRNNFFADSGAIAMATVLTAIAHSKSPVSAQIAPIARYAQSGEINFHCEDKDGALADLRRTFASEGTIDDLDGVTVDCFATKGWWCNVRKSNTEPLLRLNLEARDAQTMRAMTDRIAPMLGERAEE